MARFAQYALAASEEALEDAGWKPTSFEQRESTGICLGSGIGNFDEIYKTAVAYDKGGYRKVSPLFVPKLLINLGAGHISMKYGFMGPNHAATTACTTGAHSIGDAARFIAFGDANVMLAGGAESCIHPLAVGGFARARSLATSYNDAPEKASRPFDADREGFVVGEGGAMVVLEELEHAKARGARIYAELRGYGCSGDAHHMTAPKENGEGALIAMRKSLKNANLQPCTVDYVNAHATSTVVGDAAENAAIKALLLGPGGKRNAGDINISSTKGALGHLLGGAGAVEALFSILAIHEVTPSASSLVDASGYKFSEKDTKPGKIKLKKSVKLAKKKGDDAPDSPGSSPILPEIDEKTMAAFPTAKPREEDHLETVICKTCKRPVLKQNAAEHIRGCIRAKQEKARRKKEARDAANRAKAGDKEGDEDAAGGEGDDSMKGQKSAKKSAVKGMAEDGTKKGKKRKVEGEDDKDKEPKKKKRKEEPKPKPPKPKGPVDVEKQCGVTLPNGAQCARSLTCKSHSMGAKRAVPGRSLPYDMLLQAYQKKNQARQQKAAIDANAPLQDDMDNNGPVDSDEEKDAVMAAITRSHPQPIITQTLISTKKKYQYVRIKEMLSHALGGARGGGLFSTGDNNTASTDGNLFTPVDDVVMASPVAGSTENTTDAGNHTPGPAAKKLPIAAGS
ncbi:thiolase-like protein [Aspergillus coremiiformis]|uniref:beta-ketoacyl-[acyl-carrier-protein] synthase I n=1 Tax=Aspergillus coremiiformis TaxID=138285 RepID=A0A5N6YYM7_9EURO|nr:thiolase-like protein [Aspergillus coremiiformis]